MRALTRSAGNYATDVAAGATYKYKLLVMVLFSNIIAIFLQSLCVKLGSVTGMNLAENIKAHFPPWLNYLLWFFAEAAIIATDIAEVRSCHLHSSCPRGISSFFEEQAV